MSTLLLGKAAEGAIGTIVGGVLTAGFALGGAITLDVLQQANQRERKSSFVAG
ncbi:MAG: hypothetical protein ACJ8F3_02580 [Xanthobacteraceae bacterium]